MNHDPGGKNASKALYFFSLEFVGYNNFFWGSGHHNFPVLQFLDLKGEESRKLYQLLNSHHHMYLRREGFSVFYQLYSTCFCVILCNIC